MLSYYCSDGSMTNHVFKCSLHSNTHHSSILLDSEPIIRVFHVYILEKPTHFAKNTLL